MQSAFVRANPLPQNSNDFAGNNRVLVACDDARNRPSLSFDNCRDLFSDHTARFVLTANASRRKPHHAKSNDILCVETKPHSLEGNREPRIKHGTPMLGKSRQIGLWWHNSNAPFPWGELLTGEPR